jgi:RNA-binding protein 26
VPGQMFPMNGAPMAGSLPFMPVFPNGGLPFGVGGSVAATYDPHEARMDIGPAAGSGSGGRHSQRAPMMPRTSPEDGQMTISGSGELPVIQDLTPLPRDSTATQYSQNDMEVSHSYSDFPSTSHVNQMGRQFPNTGAGSMDTTMPSDNSRGGVGAAGGQDRTFNKEVHNFRPERRNRKTLVVEKIPDDQLSLEAVNNWFKKFGTVTNVAVDAKNKKALVSFAENNEAHAAWKSEDAVFNNRFVKVFWHRPLQGHGQLGTKMLAASAPLVANMGSKVASGPSSSNATSDQTPSSSSKKSTTTSAAALAEKHQILERQISEQKSLMASLSSASPDEKKQIMERLRKLGQEMEPAKESSSDATVATNNTHGGSKISQETRDQSMKDRLDKELELHSVTATVENGTGDSTEDLKATLAKLKAEVCGFSLP